MWSSFAFLLRRHPVLTGAFALALVAVLFFAVRLTVATIYWADPAHREQPIEGWMTPRYVAMSWDVPPETIARALSLPEKDGFGRISLDRIATERGIPLDTLVAMIEDEIAAEKARQR